MMILFLLQSFFHELKEATYVVRFLVYREKKTRETEATPERVSHLKKLAPLSQLVYFGFRVSLLDDNIFWASNSIDE
jgi:hypothetical protein